MEGLDTSEWSQEDFDLYAKWQEMLRSRDYYTSSCAALWLELVDEDDIYPSNVMEYLSDKYANAGY